MSDLPITSAPYSTQQSTTKQQLQRVLSGLTHNGNNLSQNLNRCDQQNIFMLNARYMQQLIEQRQIQRHPHLPTHMQSQIQPFLGAKM